MIKIAPLAVIYCRVSDQKQVTKGHGLDSQETRCREYAKHKGYDVMEVFQEEGLSGKLLERPQMQAMLKYLQKRKKKQEYIVIIDDISRLARNLEAHIKLRTEISSAGGKLESPSIEFGEDSDSRLVEHLLASVAAHQREKNAEQVTNRMRARMLGGYWVFQAPRGYKIKRRNGHGKLAVRHEPVATYIQRAFENLASGRFESAVEVKTFFESKPEFPKDRKGRVHQQRVHDILHNQFYTGHIHYEKWGISLMQGKHEPIVSMEIWKKAQERLRGKSKAPMRSDIHQDFPLRGFVLCDCCGNPMTSCWTKGRNAKYPYYLCQNKECEMRGKSIKRDRVEGEFHDILCSVFPNQHTLNLMEQVIFETWQRKATEHNQHSKSLEEERRQIDRKINLFVDRIAEVEPPILLRKYEAQIMELEQQKIIITEKIAKCGTVDVNLEQATQTAFEFFANAQKLWDNGDLMQKRMVLRAAFDKQLRYHPKEGYRTAAFSLPFELSRTINNMKSGMVIPVGFEPTTY